MWTLLTTPKMPAALKARVEGSVGGRLGVERKASPRGASLRLISTVRFAVPLAFVAVAVVVGHLLRQERLELERTRVSLLEEVRRESASLMPSAGKLALIESWLVRSSKAYEGDFVADGLRAPGALAALLGRSLVYVRGPIGSFATAAGVAEAAAASSEDAFIACLLDPPVSRLEKVALAKVRALVPGAHTAQVHRLAEAELVSSLLSPTWVGKVKVARDQDSLFRLRTEFEKAPIERGEQALKAEVLLAVMDESAQRGDATELDGERPHDVRVAMVDLTASRVLLRTRRHVDPTWISDGKRPVYAGALDACAMAIDVRDTVNGPSPAPVSPTR